MFWSIDFYLVLEAPEDDFGVSVASSMGGRDRKKWSFWLPEGCSRATLLLEGVLRPIWKPFACFWESLEPLFASFPKEFFCSLERTHVSSRLVETLHGFLYKKMISVLFQRLC